MLKCSTNPTYLFVLPWSLEHVGGVNQVVTNLAHEMLNSGTFEPIVLIADWDAPEPVWGETHGVRTVRWRLHPYHPRMGMKEWLAFVVWKRRFRPAFDQFCRVHQVVAINPHYPISTAFALDRIIRSFASPIPLILSYHGTDLNSLTSVPASLHAQWRRLFQSVEGIVVCSNDLGRKFVELFGDEVSPTVIHNGLDAVKFGVMRGAAVPSEQRYILNVAKFEEQKGQDVLIEAFSSIANDYPGIDLYLIGATDKKLPELKALCVNKGIEQRVKFFPDTPHQQVADFFRRSTIFALPSRQEAFGIVLLEAGAFSLPVVASRVGGIPEILTDGVTGRLVTPDNPAELAHCLRLMLDSPAAAQEMGTRLHEHVLDNFTWSAAHQKYVALLKSIGGRR